MKEGLTDRERWRETSKPNFLMSTCMFGWWFSLIRGRVTSIELGVIVLICVIIFCRPEYVILVSTSCRAVTVLARGSRM